MRLKPPPPLCDCCRPSTWLERLVWRVRGLFARRHRVGFKTVVLPRIANWTIHKIDIKGVLLDGSLDPYRYRGSSLKHPSKDKEFTLEA